LELKHTCIQTSKWLHSRASETCSLSLKVRALNAHVPAPNSAEHLMQASEFGHTLGRHCVAQPLIGGLLILCIIYCRTYGCSLYDLYILTRPSETSQNSAQCLTLYHQHTWFRPVTRKKPFLVNGFDVRLPALIPAIITQTFLIYPHMF